MHSINFSILGAAITFATSAIAFPQAPVVQPAPNSTAISTPSVPTSSSAPSSTGAAAPAYATGWCTYHLNLWDPTNGEWLVQHEPFKVQIPYIKDAKHNIIGSSNDFLPVTGASVNVNSALPYVFIVTSTGLNTGGVLNFAYGDDFWNSSSPQTSGLGAPSGHNALGSQVQQLDGGFTC